MTKRGTQNVKEDNKAQLSAFRKAAREAGADASDEGFKNVLRTLGKAKPQPPKKAKRT